MIDILLSIKKTKYLSKMKLFVALVVACHLGVVALSKEDLASGYSSEFSKYKNYITTDLWVINS